MIRNWKSRYGNTRSLIGLRLRRPSADLHIDHLRAIWRSTIEVLYLHKSSAGPAAAAFVEKHLSIANEKLLEARLEHLAGGGGGGRCRIDSLRRGLDVSDSTAVSGGVVSLKSVVPFILILMTVTGAVYPAIDLTAGERERGTLEVLMAAPIPRIGILLAKYVTVLTVALLTAAANLLTMAITIAVTGLVPELFGESGFSWGVMGAVFALLILFAAFFSAVLLVVTSTARSFKEAQAYLIPLMLVSLAPGMLSLIPDVELSGALLVTPLANIVLLGRDLLEFKATGSATLIVVASTILYAAAAIWPGGANFWGRIGAVQFAERLVRSAAPALAQAEPPTVTAGVVCLAIMFPAFYVFFHLTGLLSGDVASQLAMGVVMTAAVFGGIPLAACGVAADSDRSRLSCSRIAKTGLCRRRSGGGLAVDHLPRTDCSPAREGGDARSRTGRETSGFRDQPAVDSGAACRRRHRRRPGNLRGSLFSRVPVFCISHTDDASHGDQPCDSGGLRLLPLDFSEPFRLGTLRFEHARGTGPGVGALANRKPAPRNSAARAPQQLPDSDRVLSTAARVSRIRNLRHRPPAGRVDCRRRDRRFFRTGCTFLCDAPPAGNDECLMTNV